MKTNKNIFIILLVISFLGIRCEKDNKNNSEDTKVEFTKKGNLLITKDQDYLNSRINYIEEKVNLETVTPLLKSTNADLPIDLNKNYVFKLQAEVDPPVYEGNTIQATHVSIQDHFAFVTYNTKGDMYMGGLEIFDVTDIKNPVILWSAVFPYSDVSSIDYYNNKLYIVGATDTERDTNGLETPAFLEVINLDENRDIATIDTIINLYAYAGTDVKVTEDKIYATSGTNGALRIFDHEYNLLYQHDLDDARSIDENTENIYVLQGTNGRLNVISKTSNELLNTYNLGGATIPESKSELAVSEEYLIAALNDGGLRMLYPDGTLKQSIPKPPTPEGELDENYVTNSVTLNDELLLIGNGEAGIHVGGLHPDYNDSIVIIGKMAFRNGPSANFVESKELVIFVATGLGGLKILSINFNDGIPDDIEATTPCEALLSDIMGMFPEQQNNEARYPELFSDTVEKNLVLIKESDVYVTFIEEVADYKNTFGYYTYPKDNPPQSIDEIEHHIVFPNVSKVGDGGGLEYGDRVKLKEGPFPANTVIGFYLIANGWKNGELVEGSYTLYTTQELNFRQAQQHVLFVDEECNDLVVAYEDLRIDMTDKDYNDIIFTVKDNPSDTIPNTSFDFSRIPVK